MFDQNSPPRIEVITQNLREILARRDIKARPLSERINPGNPNMVGKFLRGGGITLSSYLAIEDELGLSPGELMRPAPTVAVEDIEALFSAAEERALRVKLNNGPSVVQMLQWYHECGGDVSADSEMIEHVDIYEHPTDDGFFVNPVRIGRESLLSKKLGHCSTADAVQTLAESNRAYTEETAKAHAEVLQGRSIFGERKIDETLSNGVVITARFERALQLGTWAGRKVVLNFAREV